MMWGLTMSKVFIGVLFLTSCLISTACFADNTVMVFATSNQQITGIPKTYTRCNLDALQTIQANLNREVSQLQADDKSHITTLVQQNSRVLSEAMTCLVQAKQYQIMQLPAVVINGRVVVYGEYDVPAALIDGASSTIRGQV